MKRAAMATADGERPLSAATERPPDEELEVMHLIVAGMTDAAIARRLGVSIITVRRRIKRLRDRIGATTRLQAAVIAARRGWL